MSVVALAPSDIVEIHQLYAAYNHAVDDGDGKAFAACFVPDGRLGGDMDVSGGEALLAFAQGVPMAIPGIRHNSSNILVSGDGDGASGKAYLTVIVSKDGQSTVLMTGKYVDSLRRAPEGWRFVERSFTGDR